LSIRKAQRRIHEDDRRPGQRSSRSSRFWTLEGDSRFLPGGERHGHGHEETFGVSRGSCADFGRFLTLKFFVVVYYCSPNTKLLLLFMELRVQMDDHVRFSGTKYEKGNNTYNGNHYKCGAAPW